MKTVLLSGGVGGAKMALGLQRVLPPGALTVIVNTADDLRLHGLYVSPDLDTVLYTLAGLVNPETGWGIEGDTLHGLRMLERYGQPTWFLLGDRDLATHVLRTRLLGEGWRPTEVAAYLAQRLGLKTKVLPMCDQPVATVVRTPEGELGFQEYFVRERCRPVVAGLEFRGVGSARLTPEVEAAFGAAELVVIGPSNPYLSVDPILSVPGLRPALLAAPGPRLAVSPIIAGRALKGPAAKIMSELGLEPSARTVAGHYRDLVDLLVVDRADEALVGSVEAPRLVALPTVMTGLEEKEALARELVRLAAELAGVRP